METDNDSILLSPPLLTPVFPACYAWFASLPKLPAETERMRRQAFPSVTFLSRPFLMRRGKENGKGITAYRGWGGKEEERKPWQFDLAKGAALSFTEPPLPPLPPYLTGPVPYELVKCLTTSHFRTRWTDLAYNAILNCFLYTNDKTTPNLFKLVFISVLAPTK